MLLFTLERASDALADGEARALGLGAAGVVRLLVSDVERALRRRRA